MPCGGGAVPPSRREGGMMLASCNQPPQEGYHKAFTNARKIFGGLDFPTSLLCSPPRSGIVSLVSRKTSQGRATLMSKITAAQARTNLNRARAIKEEIEDLEDTLSRLTASLAEYVDYVTGKHTLDNGDSFTISENNTYNRDKMESLLTGGQFKLVSARVLVNSKVKAMYPKVYEAAKEQRGVKVTL